MKTLALGIITILVLALLVVGGVRFYSRESATVPIEEGYGPNPTLPPPNPKPIPTVNVAPVDPWPEGATPKAAPGLKVNAFAKDLDHPRWLHVLPNGDVLVAETNNPVMDNPGFSFRGWITSLVMKQAGAKTTSANRITLLRDADHDGAAEIREAFLEGLNSPFGMTLSNGTLYVANTDAIVAFPYADGDTKITAPPEKIVDLPCWPINHHWTKDVIASPDGQKLYATVGSNSNVGENGVDAEKNRAGILEIDLATRNMRVFASGLRNPNGLSWNPASGELWVAVNERDEIGSDLVPDYMTSVKDGGFYGWPYSYFGQNVDVRAKPPRPDLVEKAIKPDYALGPHTASLGLTFNTGSLFGTEYQNGAFIGQHGSWNRKPRSGYKVIFVPFEKGKPNGAPKDILTGFISDTDKALGRPVGVAIDKSGALLVADDVGNIVWRVVPESKQ
ncbi:PQQ-dependent sugar dehydrogenase [Phyllobacterium zundukense]|uniref:Sorbosone dehydrogenase n=1 Tax=Phyllobacterium zundukense TaxID=1867719 RepID=A0A2N9VVW4_9HYPH|nr:sorbosone dehydrogenase family protein [Phyllobacterium zundukense]ATU91368.1 sorbosone dehydrogenase [Phyllobacterium zundukense]PIO43632.1 sorbosone dehydrogenase [Phyllobacterium zundukense]